MVRRVDDVIVPSNIKVKPRGEMKIKDHKDRDYFAEGYSGVYDKRIF